MDKITIVGIVASIGIAASLIPQVAKVVKEKKADGTSTAMIAVLITTNVIWVYYGYLREDMIIAVTNIFSFLVNALLAFLKIKYNRNKSIS